MQVQGHRRDWEQCHTKAKNLKIHYRCIHDANQKSGAQRQTMFFYEELSHFFMKDRAFETLHSYGITREGKRGGGGTGRDLIG